MDASGVRATEEETTSAERYGLRLDLERALSRRIHLSVGVKGEQDRFAGVDVRSILRLGAGWQMVKRPTWTMDATLAATWTREDLVASPRGRRNLGGELDFKSRIHLSETAHTDQRLTLYPNFDDNDDLRFEAEVTLQAALNRRLAVKLGHSLRRDNRPTPGFEKRDTTVTASLVVRFDGKAGPSPP